MKKDDLHQIENKAETLENIVPMQQELPEGMTEDELVDTVAARVLEKYSAAFEERANNKAGFTGYIKSILSPTNGYRVLWDTVGHSVSNTHKYSISEENMAAFGLTEEILDSFIAQQPPRNEGESFVLRVYEAYKGSEVDVWDEKGVATAGAVEIAL